MMKGLFSIFLFLISLSSLYAKEEPRYPVSAIPEELKTGAHAVVREDVMAFSILTKSTAKMHVHMVVTIFNDKGKHFARQAVFYDKLRKITSLKGQVYNADGMLVKRLKSNEVTDHSAFDGLYDDSRVKVADLIHGVYPYTVEFEYDVDYKFLYHIQGSWINAHEDVSVQHATYQLVFPESLKPRYRAYNVQTEPKREKNNDIVTLTWSFENIRAQKFEPYSDRSQFITKIEAAPTIF